MYTADPDMERQVSCFLLNSLESYLLLLDHSRMRGPRAAAASAAAAAAATTTDTAAADSFLSAAAANAAAALHFFCFWFVWP